MSFIRRKRTTALSKPAAIKKVIKVASKTASSGTNANVINSNQTKKRIAIIGSGVSGLTCAHYLAKLHEVTVFEAGDYIGGHVNTIDVTLQDDNKSKGKKAEDSKTETSAIDTGFIVFNERTYPNFFRLLHELQVPFQATDMSFSVKNTARNFEYNGHTLNTLLSQRKNVLKPKFWQFIKDILQFNKHIKQLRQDFEQARSQGNEQKVSALTTQTLGGYLERKRYGKLFTDNYLLPMVSAIWSTSLEEIQDFPLVFFAQFFDNHGLLDVVNRPQWFTIRGGSKQYVNKLVRRFVKAGGTVRVNSPVQSVTRHNNNGDTANQGNATVSIVVGMLTNSQTDEPVNSTTETLAFDEVIFACHADTALQLLSDASPDETEILSHFHFTKNTAVLHTDSSVLPKKSLAWASWNYLLEDKLALKNSRKSTQNEERASAALKPVLTYHMNILQRLTKQHNYLVTLNHDIDNAQVLKRINYSHPVYNNEMISAQHQWSRISGKAGMHTHFCGAYWFNGFHEDGVRSGLRVCQDLGSKVSIKDDVDPSHLPDIESAHTPFRYRDLPVKADKKASKLKKRQIVTVSTNQELVEYVASLQPAMKKPVAVKLNKQKRGLFAKRFQSKSEKAKAEKG